MFQKILLQVEVHLLFKTAPKTLLRQLLLISWSLKW